MSDAEAALHEAIIDLCWKATPTGYTRDGDVSAYILPKGAVHRLVGAAQCVGILAALRAEGAPSDRAEALREALQEAREVSQSTPASSKRQMPTIQNRAEEAAKHANLKALTEALRDDPSSVTIVFCDSPGDSNGEATA